MDADRRRPRIVGHVSHATVHVLPPWEERARKTLRRGATVADLTNLYVFGLVCGLEDPATWPTDVARALDEVRRHIGKQRRSARRDRQIDAQLMAGEMVVRLRAAKLIVDLRRGRMAWDGVPEFLKETEPLRIAEMRRVAEQFRWLAAADIEESAGRRGRPRKVPALRSVPDGGGGPPQRRRIVLLRLEALVRRAVLAATRRRREPVAHSLAVVFLEHLRHTQPHVYGRILERARELKGQRTERSIGPRQALLRALRADPDLRFRSLEALMTQKKGKLGE